MTETVGKIESLTDQAALLGVLVRIGDQLEDLAWQAQRIADKLNPVEEKDNE